MVISSISSAIKIARSVLKRAKRHNMAVSSAGIAFYALLALVPTMIALVSIYALVADPAEIEQQVADVAGNVDPDTQAFLTSQLGSIVGDVEDASNEPNSAGHWVALFASIGLALFSASVAVNKLLGTIALAYEAPESRNGLKLRMLAYAFTTAAIVGAAAMAFIVAILPQMLRNDVAQSGFEAAWPLLQPLIIVSGFSLAMTVLYRYGPDTPKNRTSWINPGAIVAAVLFTLFSVAFGYYSTAVGAMPASYGLLGGIAAIMIFLQLAATAAILGAETNGYFRSLNQATTKASRRVTAEEEEPIPFGRALLGLAALFALDKVNKD